MNFSQFLMILRARKVVLLSVAISTIVLVLVGSLLWPKSYKATATVVLNYKGLDPVTGQPSAGSMMPGFIATQIDIIGSKNVALRVVDALKLAQAPAVVEQFRDATEGRGDIRDWLADLLLRKLDITPSRESSVIEISFRGSDPDFVAAIANAFAHEYQNANVALKVDPSRKASSYFAVQIKQLRDNYEAAQSRLSKYQQEHGLVSVDNRLDVESNRLNDLSSQLVAAQGALMEANSRDRMVRSGGESPDVAGNPLILNLKTQVSSAEAKFAEVSSRLAQNHPLYQSSKAELDKLRSELAAQSGLAGSSVGNNAQILQQREASIRAALQEQKTRLLELNRTRDELGVLQRDVESAQRALDATALRLSQTSIEGAYEQSEVSLLNPAVSPLYPATPIVWLNTLVAALVGTMLGVILTLVLEMFDRRVRSEHDLVELAQLPVLGSIDWNGSTVRRSKRRLGSRAASRALQLN
ncbi:chain length determinant protein EpsF [Duganella sp. PWIR1]